MHIVYNNNILIYIILYFNKYNIMNLYDMHLLVWTITVQDAQYIH
jgi:hypothetical protein